MSLEVRNGAATALLGELGSPTSQCVVHVEGVGNVNSKPQDIANAATMPGPIFVKLGPNVAPLGNTWAEHLITRLIDLANE